MRKARTCIGRGNKQQQNHCPVATGMGGKRGVGLRGGGALVYFEDQVFYSQTAMCRFLTIDPLHSDGVSISHFRFKKGCCQLQVKVCARNFG